MYDKNVYKRDVTCAWSPPGTNCHTFECDVFYGRPLRPIQVDTGSWDVESAYWGHAINTSIFSMLISVGINIMSNHW